MIWTRFLLEIITGTFVCSGLIAALALGLVFSRCVLG